MEKFKQWLEKDPSWKKSMFVVLATSSITITYMALVGFFVANSNQLDWSFVKVLGLLLVAALVEEIQYRYIPILLALILFKKNLTGVTIVVICASIIFGLEHGPLIHIAFQGVLGLVLSFVFLKCGGLNDKIFKALACSTLAHYLYNVTLLMITTLRF